MNPLGGTLTFVFVLIVLLFESRYAVTAIIAAVCYLTQGQEVTLGFHFTAIRLVLLAGLIRIIVRGEIRQIQSHSIDRSIVAYAVSIAIVASIRLGTMEEFIYQIGGLYNILLP